MLLKDDKMCPFINFFHNYRLILNTSQKWKGVGKGQKTYGVFGHQWEKNLSIETEDKEERIAPQNHNNKNNIAIVMIYGNLCARPCIKQFTWIT